MADFLNYQSDEVVVFEKPTVFVEECAYLPAISIPVQTKSHFSCPKHWLPYLHSLLHGVTNLLVIGWSGGERHFLKQVVPVLAKNSALTLTIVSDTEGSAIQT